jgi:NAD(P)-dependent dehydrogenase (short-subunit alcohol dehydrogenase family)
LVAAFGKHGMKTAMGARVPEVSKQRALSSALGRAGEPEEIASVVDFLIADGQLRDLHDNRIEDIG